MKIIATGADACGFEEKCTKEISIIITNTITDDVKCGLELYGLATGELAPDNAVDRTRHWLSVFCQNPLGDGLFAIAKHQDEVIGFFSIIDMEMLVRGLPIRAGKTEFLVIKKEMRNLIIPGTDMALPWIVFQRLREQAKNYGYQVLLNVPSLAASIFHRPSGDVRLQTLLVSFKVPGEPGERAGRIGRYAARLLRSHKLAIAHRHLCELAGTGRINAVTQVEQLGGDVGYIGDNALMSPRAEMVNMRFPSQKYLKYLLDMPGKAPLLFVFDQPAPRASVNLVHWSGLPASFDLFAAVLVAVMDRIREEKARELVIEIPTKQLPNSYRLEDCGFLKFRQRHDFDCYLMDTSDRLQLKEIPNWHITHGHKGFYSWRD